MARRAGRRGTGDLSLDGEPLDSAIAGAARGGRAACGLGEWPSRGASGAHRFRSRRRLHDGFGVFYDENDEVAASASSASEENGLEYAAAILRSVRKSG